MENQKYTSKKKKAIFLAILAALLYGISAPASKILLTKIPPALMAALLYLGAGWGMLMVNLLKRRQEAKEANLTKAEFPFVIAMIILDIIAPILLMIGLTMTNAGNVSLLNNFEIVATSLIALIFFREAVSRRMWIAIALITLASFVLSIHDIENFSFSIGSLLVLLASISWGFENNCTRKLSIKDPLQVVIIKGFGSGLGALLIALFLQDYTFDISAILLALSLGFVAYGLSIYFYISAQRELGATRTSAYYATAPFIGVMASFLVLQEQVTFFFFLALMIMLLGTYFAVSEKHNHEHVHEAVTHEHKHHHSDGHHHHSHQGDVIGEHSHRHTHVLLIHSHGHTPDLHHQHQHKN